ncbi:MAG TPA: amidohydrolase family protein [Deltaproteobacteria bacterium]|nr:amidohydrolase family protein [Deltaproteobacteria bacterium]
MKQRLICGKMVIDGAGNPPIEGGAILVEGEKIIAVGKPDELEKTPDTEVIDCGDQVMLPGLIDCHNHLSLDTRLDNYLHRMRDSIPELTLRAVETMAVDLKAGVTTSRCIGDKEFLDISCKKSVEEGRLKGPRLIVATRGIRASHGHGYVGYPFNGPESIRIAVRENLLAGADFIKLYITGTVKGSGEIVSYLSKPEISLAVEEAHRVGVKTATHCIGGRGMDWAVEIGIDSIEHAYFITDQQIDLLDRSDSRLVLTPSLFFAEERIETLQPELADVFRRERDLVGERMAAVIKGGLNYAVGTDGMHGGLAKEMAILADLGASNSDVLKAATVYGSQVCGLEDEIGTLEPGKSADIIGVKGNPLEDIRSLENIETVILKGRLVHQQISE